MTTMATLATLYLMLCMQPHPLTGKWTVFIGEKKGRGEAIRTMSFEVQEKHVVFRTLDDDDGEWGDTTLLTITKQKPLTATRTAGNGTTTWTFNTIGDIAFEAVTRRKNAKKIYLSGVREDE